MGQIPTDFPYGITTPIVTGGGALSYGGGNNFFVGGTSAGSAGNPGTEPNHSVATISAAIALCTANNGDRIHVLPGYTETVATAAALTLSTAGISIIGYGSGASRPTITMSATGSTVLMGAASVSIHNILFVITADTTIILDIDATDCWVDGCEFRYGSGKEFGAAIDVNGGSANNCDRTKITNCLIISPTAGANQGIELGEVAEGVVIGGCRVWGDYANASIHNPTGKVLTNLLIHDCSLENANSGNHSIELVSACTGMLVRNLYKNDMTQATGSDPGSCHSFECYHDDAVDTSAIVSPAVT